MENRGRPFVLVVSSINNKWNVNCRLVNLLNDIFGDWAHIFVASPSFSWDKPFQRGESPDMIFLPEDQSSLLDQIVLSLSADGNLARTKIVIVKEDRVSEAGQVDGRPRIFLIGGLIQRAAVKELFERIFASEHSSCEEIANCFRVALERSPK